MSPKFPQVPFESLPIPSNSALLPAQHVFPQIQFLPHLPQSTRFPQVPSSSLNRSGSISLPPVAQVPPFSLPQVPVSSPKFPSSFLQFLPAHVKYPPIPNSSPLTTMFPPSIPQVHTHSRFTECDRKLSKKHLSMTWPCVHYTVVNATRNAGTKDFFAVNYRKNIYP